MNREEYLWTEKYRPDNIDDIILPQRIKEQFKGFVKAGRIPNLLLSGGAGIGKTTIARALSKELGGEPMIINASLERNIDVLRNRVADFASTASLVGCSNRKKIVIFDEADNLNATSVQPALRGFIEEFHSTTSFIFTCNYKQRISEPIHSRCTVIDFDIEKTPKLAAEFFVRVQDILAKEGVKFEREVLAQVVKKFFPDFRRTLNELQRYSSSGDIDTGILQVIDEGSITTLVNILKEKDFRLLRQWVATHYNLGADTIITKLYEEASKVLEPKSIPDIIMILNEGQKADAIVANRELNTMAMLTDIMANCKFK